MKIITSIILVFTLSNSCDKLMEKWHGIKIQNNTDKVIFVSAGSERYGLFSYPDTVLTTSRPSLLSVSPTHYNNLRSSIKWKEIIENLPEKKLSIYFFNSDTINQYSWQEIKLGNKIMKRFDVTIEDLERLNYSITYPFGSDLKYIKQFPAYGQ